MKNPASIPLQAQGPQGLQIQIPREEDIQNFLREKEDRRQQALERLRNENRALPLASFCPSVPRPAPVGGSLSGAKKN